MTRLSSHAARSAAMPASSSARRSPQRTSAPSTAGVGTTSNRLDCAAAARAWAFGMYTSVLLAPRRTVPVHDFLAGPEHDSAHFLQRRPNLFEILDAERRAGDVRVHRDRHDFRARGRFRVESLEVVHAAGVKLLR